MSSFQLQTWHFVKLLVHNVKSRASQQFSQFQKLSSSFWEREAVLCARFCWRPSPGFLNNAKVSRYRVAVWRLPPDLSQTPSLCEGNGCFFAYSCLGAFWFAIEACFLTIGAPLLTIKACLRKVHLISTLRNCKQRSSTVSNKRYKPPNCK